MCGRGPFRVYPRAHLMLLTYFREQIPCKKLMLAPFKRLDIDNIKLVR